MLQTVQINSSEWTSFREQLYQSAKELAKKNYSRIHLKIVKSLTDAELEQLGVYIENEKPFPYTKLSLIVDFNALNNPKFLDILQKLNRTSISGVELIFSTKELKQSYDDISNALTLRVAPTVSYPVQVREFDGESIVASYMGFRDFQDIVIANIQKRNNEATGLRELDTAKIVSKKIAEPKDPLNKKIKLKELVRRDKLSSEDLAQYIPVEMQHVEMVEQEVVLEQQEVVEIAYQVQLNEIQEYGGQLLGFEDFSAPLYKNRVRELLQDERLRRSLYELLQTELFANLPHAIKYISPDAAEQLSLNLPGLVTLNKDNLPNGFNLKQTKQGELVLDFDPYLENEQSNLFTPVEFDLDAEPIYNIELQEPDVKKWIGDSYHRWAKSRLINMWVKYGNEGVTAFFKNIEKATEGNGSIFDFLFRCYLIHLPQWDHLNDNAFFACLKRISHYDKEKISCFQNFLIHTGSSRHNLIKTTEAFEAFWNELTLLCVEQKVSIEGINQCKWTTPKGGNPVVFMERMLFILKNARKLEDQFKLLDNLALDNYGGYYASRFEGFRAVSAKMALNYDAKKQNQLTYSKDFHLYRVELNTLAEHFLLASRNNCISDCLRVIGIQSAGITVSSLCEQIKQSEEMSSSDSYNSAVEMLATLFFVSHERFIENQPLDLLFRVLRYSSNHDVLDDAVRPLNTLYNLDIKLNQAEGLMLFESVGGMNSAEFQSMGISKKESLTKLFKHLEENKFAVFKYFNFRFTKRVNPKFPLLYALDTAEYLAKDPIIAATYHDDLMLFSGLINSNVKDAYYYARTDQSTALIINKLNRVQLYLHQAATQPKPNNLQYAIQVILNAKNFFTYDDFINACAKIVLQKEFESKMVDDVLREHNFILDVEIPEIFTKDNFDLKNIMILTIDLLEETIKKNNSSERGLDTEVVTNKGPVNLYLLSISELQMRLAQLWKKAGTLLYITESIRINQILKTTKELAIQFTFPNDSPNVLVKVFGKKIADLSSFQDYGDFEKVNQITHEIKQIADLLYKLYKTVEEVLVLEHEQDFADLFQRVNFSKLDYEMLYGILHLLNTMPQRNNVSLLSTILSNDRFLGKKERVMELLRLIRNLNKSCFPTAYLDAFSKLVIATPGQKDFRVIMHQMIKVYDNDNKDPILELIMSDNKLTYKQATDILQICEGIDKNRDKVGVFLLHLVKTKKLKLLLKQIVNTDASEQKKILEMLSNGHSLNRNPIEYEALATFLVGLSKNHIELLATFYQTTPVSAETFLAALTRLEFKQPDNFDSFLLEFEKAPFGERDLQQQFSSLEVERVINQSKDLINQSTYTYQYRKQLMESFLFVNEIGQTLPVYYNKSAKDLTNAQIKAYFADLKAKRIPGLTPFQNRLMALGLMREAMYRSTGEFPYSTQLIALIDGMMHQGDFISNIDTGQGKSLVDSMKAALLWLDSDRVELTTSSLVDAKRDIANYGPFLKLLGIPYSESPITSASPVETFQQNGINFSTFAQLSLFFAKAKVTGQKIETSTTSVSLVANESDYTILDDRVIYRFATADGSGIGYGQEWIYEGINEFVTRKEFIDNSLSTARDDIDDLKAYLAMKAKALKKSGKIVNKFDDAQYLIWLESALTVNYILKENVDYVIPDEFEKKIINGTELRSKVVKVLMRDGKVSPDSSFGNGIQQFLCARLNIERGGNDFVIEPQNKTIISTNNKNLIDYYRSKKGFIWGSSGTVGSDTEIQEQYAKFGFDFSKAEPHQKNRVVLNTPVYASDESAQFKKLITALTANLTPDATSPSLVFCKDINTATRFYNALKMQNPNNFPLQLYTGLGSEEDYIKNAGKPGMITITTSALGRNTDIRYDRIQGLRVWHTFIDSIRNMGQKSGRTGRQGSAGEVNLVLNEQELGNKDQNKIQEELDQLVALERSVNEELYNVLGFLLTKVDLLAEEKFVKGKTAFLRESWSQFSADTEAQFRDTRRDAVFDKEAFIKKTLASFNSILTAGSTPPIDEVTIEDLSQKTEQTHQEKAQYLPHKDEMKLEDCTPPVTIAYHLLQYVDDDDQADASKAAIKVKLKKLFSRMQNDTFVAKNNDYLTYLVSNPTTQAVVVDAHKEFLLQYLQDHSQKLNFVQRWFGCEGKLSKVASNQNYLVMFHAFASIPASHAIELKTIQDAISTLLEEYVETGWFINAERKTSAMDLKCIIKSAKNLDDVIHYLSQAQVELAKIDIEENKRRRGKPLHLYGHSRYQTTLNRALNLASSLSGKFNVDEVAEGLAPLIAEVTDKSPMTDLTRDELKRRAESEKSDKRNASVIISTLENALAIKERKIPQGMAGRNGIFTPPQKANKKDQDEIHEADDHDLEQGNKL